MYEFVAQWKFQAGAWDLLRIDGPVCQSTGGSVMAGKGNAELQNAERLDWFDCSRPLLPAGYSKGIFT